MVRKLAVVLLLLAAQCSAHVRHHRVSVYRAFPPSHSSLVAQNIEIDRLGLPRIQTDAELAELVESGDLVPVMETRSLKIAANLPKNRRYCKQWTWQFLQDISTHYYAAYDKPLQVNSAVRTVRVQRSLTHWNHNAAPAHGETASSHLAGLTVDIARRGLSKAQIKWVETYLLNLGEQVIVEEEIQQPCFHILVRGNYGKEL
jgi:hypothetical protein